MSFTYDVTTERGKVRLLITDVQAATSIFADAEIDAFLALEGGVVKRAAARALATIAANEVLVQKRIRLLDLQTDGPAEAAELRALAKQLRDEAADEAAVAAGQTSATLVYPPLVSASGRRA